MSDVEEKRPAATTPTCARAPKTKNNEDLVGRVFGFLQCVSPSQERSRSGGRRWLMRCKCGGEKVVATADLNSGHVISCGCMKYMRPKGARRPVQPAHDITGKRFGTLFVEGPDYSTGHRMWRARCECGSVRLYGSDVLRRNKSCGCRREKAISDFQARKRVIDDRALNNHYRSYIKAAQARDLPFLLTVAEFIRIIALPCYYCGEPPRPTLIQLDVGRAPVETCRNGIDRLDSSLGYVLSNVVPCCSMCNRMKLDHSKDEFLAKVMAIAATHGNRNSEAIA